MRLSKSTYYFEVSKDDKVAIRNEELTKEIVKLFNKHKGRYGVRRIYHALKAKGIHVNHKRVQRIMHINGLLGKCPKKRYHSYKGNVGRIADNIIDRNFTATAPFQKWTTDVSQFNFPWGKCYISPILDMFTNEIISYDLSLSPNFEQIKNMLNKAYEKFPTLNGLIFHSDQGWQYQHGRLKNEIYYGYENNYKSFKEFSNAMKEYIDYYNNERIQAKTKWMPPVQYRLASMS